MVIILTKNGVKRIDQKIIKTNEPLYFYHLVNKDADMNKGLLSLQYMYDNKLKNTKTE